MVYEKDKIKHLIEYKDKIINEQIKNDLEWILEAYNEQYVDYKRYEKKRKEYATMMERYYTIEDEKANFKEKLYLLKRKYNVLKCNYRELQEDYRTCCKKIKNMI